MHRRVFIHCTLPVFIIKFNAWLVILVLTILCFSGYDFGYMLKVLTSQRLPEEEQEFFELLKLYFPNIYDVKYLMKSCKNLKGGLQEVAEQLEVVLEYLFSLEI